MSVTSLAGTLPRPKMPWIKAPPWWSKSVGSAGRLLYEELLWFATRFGKDRIRVTVAMMAKLLGKSIRWVYKALRQLLGKRDEHDETPRVAPTSVINRFRVYGSRDEAGVVTEIVITDEFAGPEPTPKAGPAPRGRAAGKTTAGQVPNVGPAKPTTPQQQAAADRTHAETSALNAEADEPLTPEFFERWRQEHGITRAAPKAAPRPAAAKRTPEELNAQLDRVKARWAAAQDSPAEPAGPEVPAAEPSA